MWNINMPAMWGLLEQHKFHWYLTDTYFLKLLFYLNSSILLLAQSTGLFPQHPNHSILLCNSDWFNVDCQICSISTQCWFAEQSLVFNKVQHIGRLKQAACLTTKLLSCMFVIFFLPRRFRFVSSCNFVVLWSNSTIYYVLNFLSLSKVIKSHNPIVIMQG